MKKVRLLLLISWGMLTTASLQANQDTVIIKGVIRDMLSGQFLNGVSILQPTQGYSNASMGKGNFEITALKRDTFFLFFPGYRTAKISMADSVLKKTYNVEIALEPLYTGLGQAVIIKAPKTLEQIEEDRKKLGQTPKELERPIIEPFSSPISALYELLSQRSREREKLKKQIIEDDRRRIFRELLDYYNENDLIDLPEEYYEDFINYCNLPLEFFKYSSDYEITKTVTDQYKRYGRLNGIIK